MVLDVDDFYILEGEYMHCSLCKKNQISWSRTILDQLDPGTKFPVQILYKTVCDERVIGMMHQRSLGKNIYFNSVSHVFLIYTYSKCI